jgi:hypothetical protein
MESVLVDLIMPRSA